MDMGDMLNMSDGAEFIEDTKCIVCGGDILRRTAIPYIPKNDGGLFGPGSYNIATEKDRITLGWHCSNCGIEYRHPPKKKKENDDDTGAHTPCHTGSGQSHH